MHNNYIQLGNWDIHIPHLTIVTLLILPSNPSLHSHPISTKSASQCFTVSLLFLFKLSIFEILIRDIVWYLAFYIFFTLSISDLAYLALWFQDPFFCNENISANLSFFVTD